MRAADQERTLAFPHVMDAGYRVLPQRIGSNVWAFVVCIAVLGFAFQGARGIWEPDEGRYVAVALNMLTTGDYIVPRLDAEHPHYAKPPLTYWAIAASIASFGRTEFAARLPSALAYVLTALSVWALGATLGLRRPVMAAAIWSTTLLPFVAGSIVTADMLLTLFESVAVLGYLQWRLRGSQRGLWLLWLALGVAFMTKGPPALLPLLAIFAFEGSRGRTTRMRGLCRIAPLVAFAAIALWWFLHLLIRDPSLWRYFLVNETFDRVATAMHDRNPGWRGLINVYAPVVLVGTLPFGPLLIWSLVRHKPAVQQWPGAVGRRVPRAFLYLWMAVPFTVFALAQSRLPLYLLPLTVPFALTTASRFEEAEVSDRSIRLAAVLSAVALLTLRLVSAHWSTEWDTRALAQDLGAVANINDYDEIVFVDGRRPAYGLEFYTGKQVEAAYTNDGAHSSASEPFCAQLQERGAPLFLVPAAYADGYVQKATQCDGTRLLSVGHVRRFALFEIDGRYSVS